MPIDLTGGIDPSREFTFATRPDDAEMRDSASFWVFDDDGRFGLPRIGIEAVAANWETHGVQVNVALGDGRVFRLRDEAPSAAVAGSDGRLETNGTFENSGTTGEWLRYVRLKEAEKSELGKRLFSYRTSDEDIELWIELLKSARREFQDSFPETPFIVVLLNSPTPTTQKMEEALKKSGLTYHLCYSESPDLREEKYKIPVDRHPNALGAEKLADYMINFPLKDVLKNR